MIRLLWLFLILDVAISSLFIITAWAGGVDNPHDSGYRVLIELAALAIIEAVRERKA